jgi:hypothetical protein
LDSRAKHRLLGLHVFGDGGGVMNIELTLDEALDAFENAPDPFVALDLREVAKEYLADGMIEQLEYDRIIAQIEDWEAYHDPF